MPVPPPSAMSVGSEGSGARLPISSSAIRSGGSSRAPGDRAATRRAVSTRSSTRAATNAALFPAPAPVASRYSVPRLRMNCSGSKCSPSDGLTASKTRGSASAARASDTPCQMLSRVRGSESSIASNDSAQPVAASGEPVRIATASAAAAGSSVQRKSSAGVLRSSAAAWRSACSATRVLPSQKPPPSTPPEESSVAAARPVARIIAVSGSSQPLMGDHRSPAGMPSARCCGSKTATGPSRSLALSVTVRLSGRVDVVTTAPGASRIAGITTWSPFPERGGPISKIESSTLAQICLPCERPSKKPTSSGFGYSSEGRSVAARRRSAFEDALDATSCPLAVPWSLRGSVVTAREWRRIRVQVQAIAEVSKPRRRAATHQ